MLYEKGKMTINEAMKWPTDKARYDANYLRIYGEQCDACKGRGYYKDKVPGMKKKVKTTCIICDGAGYIKKPENEREQNV